MDADTLQAESPGASPLEWECDLGRLPERLARCFSRLTDDDAASAFIRLAQRRRHGHFVSFLHSVLRGFASDFEVNGALGTYPMHLLSAAQWAELLGATAGGRLLDVGAGNGDVTSSLASSFSEVVTTETSVFMARRLRRRGYACLRLDVAEQGVPDGQWDVISCLNVLDRSNRPRTLLTHLRDGVRSGGRIVLSTPLPYDPFVYDGGRTLPPVERLRVSAERWEDALLELVSAELEPQGLAVERFTRAPYLSGGDTRRALYVLDAAVLVCRVL